MGEMAAIYAVEWYGPIPNHTQCADNRMAARLWPIAGMGE